MSNNENHNDEGIQRAYFSNHFGKRLHHYGGIFCNLESQVHSYLQRKQTPHWLTSNDFKAFEAFHNNLIFWGKTWWSWYKDVTARGAAKQLDIFFRPESNSERLTNNLICMVGILFFMDEKYREMTELADGKPSFQFTDTGLTDDDLDIAEQLFLDSCLVIREILAFEFAMDSIHTEEKDKVQLHQAFSRLMDETHEMREDLNHALPLLKEIHKMSCKHDFTGTQWISIAWVSRVVFKEKGKASSSDSLKSMLIQLMKGFKLRKSKKGGKVINTYELEDIATVLSKKFPEMDKASWIKFILEKRKEDIK